METNEYVYANTHAALLNELLGTDYKAWMKSSIMLPDGKRLWMIQLGDFIASSGWKNYLASEDRIIEEQVSELQYQNQGTAIKSGKYDEDRVVFDFDKTQKNRKYIFRGVFRINRNLSTEMKNVWDKISDEYLIGNDDVVTSNQNDESINKSESVSPSEFESIYETIRKESKNLKDGCSTQMQIAIVWAHAFLRLYADQMLYAPNKMTLDKMRKIWVDDSIQHAAILYQPIMETQTHFVAELAGVLLALDANGHFRFFTIEHSFPLAICEYSKGKHLNYGQVNNMQEALEKINDYLNCVD
jgi:hypothetical protein